MTRPVVVIDYADDDQDPMQFRQDDWVYNLHRTIPFNAHEMTGEHFKSIAPDINYLKDKGEFEVSRNSSYPLAIWYGGFVEACKNYNKIKQKLL